MQDSLSRPIVGRFAPSPTGFMHLGNARSALLAWLQVRALGGQMILRIEDLDRQRLRPEADAALAEDLAWLGLDWDAEHKQSERLDIYQTYLEQLETYACTCSRKDIREAASAPHVPEGIYPQLCKRGPRESDRPLALRWHCPEQTICVDDLRLGRLCQSLPNEVGDFVLQRNDGVFAYHLAVVVDDSLMGVTHIARGEDLWQSTPRQVALQQALGFETPIYLHLPLMRDFRGERLAKRGGAPSLRDLRLAGQDPRRVLADLAKSLAWQVPDLISAEQLLSEYGERIAAAQF